MRVKNNVWLDGTLDKLEQSRIYESYATLCAKCSLLFVNQHIRSGIFFVTQTQIKTPLKSEPCGLDSMVFFI